MLCSVGNVTLPTPVFIAGGAFALLAGYVAGSLGSGGHDAEVATVVSYQPRTAELCLKGDAVDDEDQAEDGVLCGTWTRARDARLPRKGDSFRFVTVDRQLDEKSDKSDVVIFGTVVG